MSDINQFIEEAAALVNKELDWLIPAEGQPPRKLRDAMRWSLFAGGKRFRPALMFAAGRAFGAADAMVMRAAAAVEMIHTYSLIHDDLPSMDDDDLRRGRETCHKKYGEATAILAGDALQALAFQTIAEDSSNPDEVKIRLISGLGEAAACMVVGQQLDLLAEGQAVDEELVESIHQNKTGALIAFSAEAGAIIAGAGVEAIASIRQYGKRLGLLFQIVDDILDETEETVALGKTAGKDAAAEKATFTRIYGVEESGQIARRIAEETAGSIEFLGTDGKILRSMIELVSVRRS
ncbi:MAG: polyprenyl synthetase family protein [Acidobacteria bacterium]|nr:polyprenyl synthetase family protein [Acidobacteriota bacterium]